MQGLLSWNLLFDVWFALPCLLSGGILICFALLYGINAWRAGEALDDVVKVVGLFIVSVVLWLPVVLVIVELGLWWLSWQGFKCVFPSEFEPPLEDPPLEAADGHSD